MKHLGNPIVFVLGYICFMFPTYVLPFFGSNSLAGNLVVHAAHNRSYPPFWLHLACLVVLIVLTWYRGAHVDKKWLAIFPFLALLFDMVPGFSLIPFIPTGLHVAAIIMGVRGTGIDTPTRPA